MENNQDNALIFPSEKQAIIVIVITMLLTALLGPLFAGLGINKNLLLLLEGFYIVPALLFVSRKNLPFIPVFRLRPVSWRVVIFSIIIGFSITVVLDEIDRIVQLFFPLPEIFQESIEKSLIITSFGDFILITFSAVFLAAVCEELLFRGFLQTSLENAFDTTKAVMLTALIFAIGHIIPWWIIQITLIGIFLGVLSWKTNSVVPPAIVHVIFNGTALLFVNLDESFFSWYFYKNHVNPIIILISVILLYLGFKQIYACYERTNINKPTDSTHQDWNHTIQ